MNNSNINPSFSQEDNAKYALFRAIYCVQTDSRDRATLNYGSPTCWSNASESKDLEPIHINHFAFEGVKYRFRSELVLTPFYDDFHEFLCVEKKEHSLFVYARTKSELIEEIHESYSFLWEQYAQAKPEELSPQAQLLAETLKQDLEIV